MIIKYIQDEVFQDYKKASMLIAFPNCSFKCDREYGQPICQNGELANSPNIEIPISKIIKRYRSNPVTKAIVFGGLEPLDSFEDMLCIIYTIRHIAEIKDDIIIYTGYNKDEIIDKIKDLRVVPNIIIKYGRFIPNRQKRFDPILGIWLASDNQYAEKIS